MSDLKLKLEEVLGKSISMICPNNFHDLTHNHCAHFVSHIANLTFSFNCVEFKGGGKQPANVRVHEIFEKCPKVGIFNDANQSEVQLVFVTRKNNVDLVRKKMGNIPQKHIGIFCDGMVYHYSNTLDKVVKWTPSKFLNNFQTVYSGDQGLFFGDIPGSDLLLNIRPSGTQVSNGIPFKLEQRNSKWIGQALSGINEDEFLIGREVHNLAKEYNGIYMPVSEYYGEKYKATEYTNEIDHWAYLIDATAHCESKGFMNLVNSYDRAKFTFGFYQLAAHTPQDNLILLFRELMTLPKAKEYFPELQMHNGTLHRVDNNGIMSNLETEVNGQLQLFMDFLNPRRKLIDEQEILHAARLIHWTAHDPACRAAQVRISAEILQHKMSARYSHWYKLNGHDDTICAIIADIHHQGRASRNIVTEALSSTSKEAALLSVNNHQYQSRNERLKAKIEEMKELNILGNKVYDAALNEFVNK